jgi:hypothetical protein
MELIPLKRWSKFIIKKIKRRTRGLSPCVHDIKIKGNLHHLYHAKDWGKTNQRKSRVVCIRKLSVGSSENQSWLDRWLSRQPSVLRLLPATRPCNTRLRRPASRADGHGPLRIQENLCIIKLERKRILRTAKRSRKKLEGFWETLLRKEQFFPFYSHPTNQKI